MQKRASHVLANHRARVVRRRPSWKKRIKTSMVIMALLVLMPIAVALIYFYFIFQQVSATLPPLSDVGNYQPVGGTKIYYADGPLMAVLATENRRPVKLKQIGRDLVDATIAAEDKRFYEHRGVDYIGIGRAIYRNITGGDLTGQGASTITQQLARNINELGLTREKRLRRKVAEAILAMRLEQTFTKEEILELYLNQIYYGNGAYGVEAAARAYFHKNAGKLTLAESATLAGMPQRPSLYSEDRDAALRRRDWVLDRMAENGMITPSEHDEARRSPVKLYKAQPRGTVVLGAPYFVNYVVGRLAREYSEDAVFSGWSIYTTLDSRIQKAAEETLRNGIHHYGESANQGALISLDPKTGYIRAMVGGLDFKRDQFNVVTHGNRQPGSSFKPIVYTAGIDTGTCDLSKSYRDDKYFPGTRRGNKWYPKNYSGKYSYGYMTVRSAIRHSINTIAVKVAMETGLHNVIDYAHRLGISSDIDPYPTLALGAWKTGVKPIELCSAYSVFANGGKRAIPMGITRVLASNGDIIEENQVQVEDPHLKAETVEQMNDALQEVVLHGTGTLAADVPHAHGKTGTTSDNRDAWFAGYTPELTTVVWAGRERRSRAGKVVRYLEMPGATGGHLCAPIWRDFMLKAVPVQQAVNKNAARRQALERAVPVDSKKEAARKRAEREEAKRSGEDNPASAPDSKPEEAVPGGTEPDTTPTDTTSVPPGSTPLIIAPTSSGPSPVLPPSRATVPDAPTASLPGSRLSPNLSGTSLRPGGESGPRMSEPGGRLSTPPVPRSDPDDEMVTVRLCADSMRRAGSWCDATVERRMRRRDIPGRCRIHRPPPGEE